MELLRFVPSSRRLEGSFKSPMVDTSQPKISKGVVIMAVVNKQYQAFQAAFDYFNKELSEAHCQTSCSRSAVIKEPMASLLPGSGGKLTQQIPICTKSH